MGEEIINVKVEIIKLLLNLAVNLFIQHIRIDHSI